MAGRFNNKSKQCKYLMVDIRYCRISGIRPDIRLSRNIEFFFRKVFNKSAYRSLLYIDIILFVKTIFDFKPFF